MSLHPLNLLLDELVLQSTLFDLSVPRLQKFIDLPFGLFLPLPFLLLLGLLLI